MRVFFLSLSDWVDRIITTYQWVMMLLIFVIFQLVLLAGLLVLVIEAVKIFL